MGSWLGTEGCGWKAGREDDSKESLGPHPKQWKLLPWWMETYAHCRASQHGFVGINLLFWAHLRASGSRQDWGYKSSGPLGWHCRPSLEGSIYTMEMTLFLDVPHPTPTYIKGNTLSSPSFRNGLPLDIKWLRIYYHLMQPIQVPLLGFQNQNPSGSDFTSCIFQISLVSLLPYSFLLSTLLPACHILPLHAYLTANFLQDAADIFM